MNERIKPTDVIGLQVPQTETQQEPAERNTGLDNLLLNMKVIRIDVNQWFPKKRRLVARLMVSAGVLALATALLLLRWSGARIFLFDGSERIMNRAATAAKITVFAVGMVVVVRLIMAAKEFLSWFACWLYPQ